MAVVEELLIAMKHAKEGTADIHRGIFNKNRAAFVLLSCEGRYKYNVRGLQAVNLQYL